MTNSSKQRLVNSFNQVVTAVHNLKTDIATEGKKAFIAEQPEDVKELLNMLDSITSLRNSIDSVASIFKAYQIDLVTETHPSEFPLEQLVKGTKPITDYPIHCFFDIGSNENSINFKFVLTIIFICIKYDQNFKCHSILYNLKYAETFFKN